MNGYLSTELASNVFLVLYNNQLNSVYHFTGMAFLTRLIVLAVLGESHSTNSQKLGFK